MKGTAPISQSLADFVVTQQWEQIPETVRERTKLHILDAIGIAYASTRFEFAHKTLAALRSFEPGDVDVIGMSARLALRDAVLMNGILVHGLDYDDTYLPGGVHMAASCFPTALGIGAQLQSSGKELLTACLLGMEAGIRLSAASKGGFLKAGFHASSMVGAFASALTAGRLIMLNSAQLVMAQGIALSTVSGTMQPLQDGAWAKRMHPGWSAVSGITAATLACQGFTGSPEAYEGRFGLFSCFLREHAADTDWNLVTKDLGQHWEFSRASIKLYPVCHHLHAFINAALGLAHEHCIDPAEVESVQALVAEVAVPMVCEPIDVKRAPNSTYETQFSLPYTIACSLVRGRFGLEETGESAYSDPKVLALAQKVSYKIDPKSGFPKFRSGEVIVRMKNGQVLARRENIFPDEPAKAEDIVKKFMANATLALSTAMAIKIRDLITGLDQAPDVRTIGRVLGGSES